MRKALFATLALVLAASAELLAKEAKPKPLPEVLVVSDVFADVPDSLRPQPGKPVYYVLLGKLEKDLGTTIRGEPHADPAMMEKAVISALASQGFVQTKIGGPMPAIAIAIMYGTATLDMDESTMPPLPPPSIGPPEKPDPTNPPPDSVTITTYYNAPEIMGLLGIDKANNIMMTDDQASRLNEAAAESRLYIFIAAFDVNALVQKKQKKVVWRTRMSVEEVHNTLPDTLTVMLASAAPYFARDLALPAFVGDAERGRAEVHVGTPVVVPDKVNSNAPSADQKKSPP